MTVYVYVGRAHTLFRVLSYNPSELRSDLCRRAPRQLESQCRHVGWLGSWGSTSVPMTKPKDWIQPTGFGSAGQQPRVGQGAREAPGGCLFGVHAMCLELGNDVGWEFGVGLDDEVPTFEHLLSQA